MQTPEQIENTKNAILAMSWAWTNHGETMEFDMEDYYIGKLENNPSKVNCSHACNTSACLSGWLSILLNKFNRSKVHAGGLPTGFIVKDSVTFGFMSDEWTYLFDSDWHHKDNTLRGAIQRLIYFSENGLPANWLDQMHGERSLPYAQIEIPVIKERPSCVVGGF